ncbi:MAG: tetratricopeptide repeat protein [Nitrospinota bacterium]
MKVLVISEKNFEVKQVNDYLEKLPFTDYLKDARLYFYSQESAKDAIKRLEETQFDTDVIIVFQKMKRMSGLQFAQLLHQKKPEHGIPIMLLIDEMNPELIKQGKKAGISSFVNLPLELDDFRGALTNLSDTLLEAEEKKRREGIENLKSMSSAEEAKPFLDEINSKAVTRMSKITGYAPWNGKAHLACSKVYMESGDYRSAIPRLKAALKITFNDKDAHRALATCYKKTGKSMEDIETLLRMLSKNPSSGELMAKLGEAYAFEGEHVEAANYFKKAIETGSPSGSNKLKARYRAGLGRSLMALGDEKDDGSKYEAGMEEFKKAVELDPRCIGASFNLVTANKKLGREAEAKELLSKLLKGTPDSEEGWLSIFFYFLEDGEPKKAKIALQKLMKFDPENQIALFLAGQAFIRLQMYRESAELFEKAAEVNPSDARTYNFLGICYRHMKLNARAITSYNKALEIDPDDYNVHFNLGRAYKETKNYHHAKIAFDTALKLRPDLEEAKAGLESLAQSIPKTAES